MGESESKIINPKLASFFIIILFTSSLSIWYLNYSTIDTKMHSKIDNISVNLANNIEIEVIHRIDLLKGFRNSWLETSNVSLLNDSQRFRSMGQFYYDFHPEIVAISLINSSGYIIDRISEDSNEGIIGLSVVRNIDGSLNLGFQQANSTKELAIGEFKTLHAMSYGFVVYYPLLLNDEIIAFFGLIFNINDVISSILSKLPLIDSVSFDLMDSDAVFYQHQSLELSNSSTYYRTQTISFYEKEWQMNISPNESERKSASFFGMTNFIIFSLCLCIPISTSLYLFRIQRNDEQMQIIKQEMMHGQRVQLIGNLSSGIAHDFNNILTIIQGNIEILKICCDEAEFSEDLREIVKNLDFATEKAKNISSKLLLIGRKSDDKKEIFDLNDQIREILPIMKSILGEKISLQVNLYDGKIFINADRTQIEQVILNLILNARDAKKNENHIIEIKTDFHNFSKKECLMLNLPLNIENCACLIVKDNGVGMAQEQLDNLFIPFYTTKKHGKGTGLGLYIIYHSVKSNDGYIDVQSKKNEGSKFSILFPLITSEDEYTPSNHPTKLQKISSLKKNALKKTKNRIFLVEDNDEVRALLKTILEKNYYEVISFDNGKSALDYYKMNPADIDLIITDIIMPHLNGIELFEKIQNLNPKIKFLFISGYPDDFLRKTENIGEDELKIIKDNFLVKPIEINTLLDKINQLIQ